MLAAGGLGEAVGQQVREVLDLERGAVLGPLVGRQAAQVARVEERDGRAGEERGALDLLELPHCGVEQEAAGGQHHRPPAALAGQRQQRAAQGGQHGPGADEHGLVAAAGPGARFGHGTQHLAAVRPAGAPVEGRAPVQPEQPARDEVLHLGVAAHVDVVGLLVAHLLLAAVGRDLPAQLLERLVQRGPPLRHEPARHAPGARQHQHHARPGRQAVEQRPHGLLHVGGLARDEVQVVEHQRVGPLGRQGGRGARRRGACRGNGRRDGGRRALQGLEVRDLLALPVLVQLEVPGLQAAHGLAVGAHHAHLERDQLDLRGEDRRRGGGRRRERARARQQQGPARQGHPGPPAGPRQHGLSAPAAGSRLPASGTAAARPRPPAGAGPSPTRSPRAGPRRPSARRARCRARR